MRIDEQSANALIEAVRQAAQTEILPHFRNLEPESIETKSGPDDLVTIADRAAEVRIATAVKLILPDAAVVGEESVAADPERLKLIESSETVVVIDPIDGTSNYAAGLALFGVILAVVHRGKTVFGLLYDPLLDDWVMARPGEGAWFHRPGRKPLPMPGPRNRPFAQAQGFLTLGLFAPERRAGMAAIFPRFLRVTALRCSCHEYRQLALGQADFLVSPNCKVWDHAAGALILGECGAVCQAILPDSSGSGTTHAFEKTTYRASIEQVRWYVVAHPLIIEQLWDILLEADKA